jgi:hypothetical protein
MAREFVDSLLDDGEELRVISARLALLSPPILIDKSSIFRHSKKCYSVRERALRRKEMLRATPEAALLVVWPGDPLPAAGDVLLVEYEVMPLRNPEAANHAVGQQPIEEIPVTEETVTEGKKASLLDKLRNFLRPPKPLVQEQEPETLEQIQQRCQHDWRPIPNGQRCIACGFQRMEFVAIGQSRADYFSTRGRARLGLRN